MEAGRYGTDWMVRDIMSQKPNKAPEPTSRSVTIPAEPGIAPARAVAHLERSAFYLWCEGAGLMREQGICGRSIYRRQSEGWVCLLRCFQFYLPVLRGRKQTAYFAGRTSSKAKVFPQFVVVGMPV
jgi:hypothetical protein